MYSLNAPVPPAVDSLVRDEQAALPTGCRPRDRLTFVVKRVGEAETDYHALAVRAREALDGESPCVARLAGLDTFDADSGPVVHLRIESPAVRTLHRRLCGTFEPISGIEGDDYVPHVTLGRGGDPDELRRFCERTVEPVSWTVSDLLLWSNRWREPVTTLSLDG